MAEKWHRIIENLEVDQYLEAQGYTKCDITIKMEIWCITSTGKLASFIWWWTSTDWKCFQCSCLTHKRYHISLTCFWDMTCRHSLCIKYVPFQSHMHIYGHMCTLTHMRVAGEQNADQVWRCPYWQSASAAEPQDRITDYLWPTLLISSIYLWPVKNDISSWRASISICILLEAEI